MLERSFVCLVTWVLAYEYLHYTPNSYLLLLLTTTHYLLISFSLSLSTTCHCGLAGRIRPHSGDDEPPVMITTKACYLTQAPSSPGPDLAGGAIATTKRKSSE
ncbi:hypothetical protein GGR50DRAFT_54360 [Xylaria sp. CBS 124048]|nr:hypothetical protein GGR50DRAFT_54360 [Xylaria sp. CBS 124048]